MKTVSSFSGILGLFFIILTVWSGAAFGGNQALENEIKYYITIFEGENPQLQHDAIGELSWKGISDPRIYDLMEVQLLRGYGERGRAIVEQMSWLAKGMALSGLEKYRQTLEKVAADAPTQKLRKHANTALERLVNYQRWNPVISQGVGDMTEGDIDRRRALNLLQASEGALIRLGGKRTYFKYWGDEQLLEAAKDKLLQDYKISGLDSTHIDALAWLCKALGRSGKPSYKVVLEEVADNSKYGKITRYAKNNAKYIK